METQSYKEKIAAALALKAEREAERKKKEAEANEAAKNTEVNEAWAEAEQENALRDKAADLEVKVSGGTNAAEESIAEAEAAIAGETDPDVLALLEQGKAEAQKEIDELNSAQNELDDTKAQIEKLNVKSENKSETGPEKPKLSEEQIKIDDDAVRTYAHYRNQRPFNKADVEKIKYIEENPEKIGEFADRVKDNIPNPDKIKEKILLHNALELGKQNKEFVKKFYQKCVEKGILKEGETEFGHDEVGPVLLEMEDEIISTERDYGGTKGNEKGRYPNQVAHAQYEEANNYLHKHERSLNKLGKEGEDTLIAVIDNYLDSVDQYLDFPDLVQGNDVDRGLGSERPLSSGITFSLDKLIADKMGGFSEEVKQIIKDKVTKIAKKAGAMASGGHVRKYYEDIVKKINSE